MHLSGPLTEATGREIAQQLKRIADVVEAYAIRGAFSDIKITTTLAAEDVHRAIEEIMNRTRFPESGAS